ncbi:MAG: hypothetical protein ACAH80_02660 [Alphaproteobacteria bacterium]
MRNLLICLTVVLLAGCSSAASMVGLGKKEEGPAYSCPAAGVVYGADIIPIFAPGSPPKPEPANLAATGLWGRYEGGCAYNNKTNEVAFTLNISFTAQKGPMGQKLEKQNLPYFVAVLSPEEKMLQREEFSTTVDFDNASAGTSTEKHTIRIPVRSKADAGKYKLAFGFILTNRQLNYNKVKNGY